MNYLHARRSNGTPLEARRRQPPPAPKVEEEERKPLLHLDGSPRDMLAVAQVCGFLATPPFLSLLIYLRPYPSSAWSRASRWLTALSSPLLSARIEQHLIALLTSPSSSAFSALPPSLPTPTLHSLALSLDFTRSIDALVHSRSRSRSRLGTPRTGTKEGREAGERRRGAGDGSNSLSVEAEGPARWRREGKGEGVGVGAGEGREAEWRRDELVFTEENLEAVRRRVNEWERSVRGG